MFLPVCVCSASALQSVGVHLCVYILRADISSSHLINNQLLLHCLESSRGEREWGEITGETRAWECVQGSLDVYVQRISVADAQQKSYMRAWYESLQDIGGLYYASTFSMQ